MNNANVCCESGLKLNAWLKLLRTNQSSVTSKYVQRHKCVCVFFLRLSDRFNVEGGRVYPRWLIDYCAAPIRGAASVTLCPLLYYLLQKQRLFKGRTQNARGQRAAAPSAAHPHRTLWKASGALRNVHVHVGGAEFYSPCVHQPRQGS